MKKHQFSITVKAGLMLFVCFTIFGFAGKNPETMRMTESQFHDHVASIIYDEGISQSDLTGMMREAELRKEECETASEYVENYMNANFEATTLFASTNRVSIVSPGQPDLNDSAACNQTALQTVISSAIGYYYAFAIRCDGTYAYDAENYTGGSTVYVRAEASTYILEAFILF